MPVPEREKHGRIPAGVLPLEAHVSMLLDADRLDAYKAAIAATVRPGDAVADLGTGTGILAVLAARAGARKVYAVEEGPIALLAREVARANGFEGVVEVVRGRSTDVDLPEPVDVLLTETIGAFGPEEHIRTSLADARRRWLRPGGRVIPRDIALWIAPVEWPGLGGSLAGVGEHLSVNLGPVDEAYACVVRRISTEVLLARGARIGRRRFGGGIDLVRGEIEGPVRISARWESTDDAGVDAAHALVGGFRAALTDSVALDRDPKRPSHWLSPVFPLGRAHGTAGLEAWVDYCERGGHRWGARGEAGVETRAEALADEAAFVAAMRELGR